MRSVRLAHPDAARPREGQAAALSKGTICGGGDMALVRGQGHKTKKAIFQALFELSQEKPYNSIKVSELCERADVSRSTFYHHFKSKFDVAVWHYDMLFDISTYRVGIELGWFDAHLIMTTGTMKYYDLYSKVRQPNSSGQFFASFYSMRREEALKHAIVDVKKMELTSKLAFQIRGLAHAEEWAIRDWYRGNIDVSVEEICEYMVSLVPQELYKALEKPEYPQESPLVGSLIRDILG